MKLEKKTLRVAKYLTCYAIQIQGHWWRLVLNNRFVFQFAKFIFKEEVESSRIVLAVLWEFVLQSGYRSLGAFLDKNTRATQQTVLNDPSRE